MSEKAEKFLKRQLKKFNIEELIKPNSPCWDESKNLNISGYFFESLIKEYLLFKKIKPFYVQAELNFVPNCKFDILFYEDRFKLVCLSLKTSLRERWKQADLEGLRMKNVYFDSETYLLTYDAPKIWPKRMQLQGIKEVITVNSKSFHKLVADLKMRSFSYFPKVTHLEKGKKFG